MTNYDKILIWQFGIQCKSEGTNTRRANSTANRQNCFFILLANPCLLDKRAITVDRALSCHIIRSARCAVLQSHKKHASKILNIGYFGINLVCKKVTNSMYVTKYKTVEKTAKLCQFFALAMKLKCQ